jgi:carbamoyltransferase
MARHSDRELLVLGLYGGDNPVDEDRARQPRDYIVGHSANAALVRDGEIVAACEQERLDRIKHSNKAPMQAVRACLDVGGRSMADIDLLAIPMIESRFDAILAARCRSSAEWAERWGSRRARGFVQKLIAASFGVSLPTARLRFVHHHQAHAALAYYTSGFDEALVLTIDGIGDDVALRVATVADHEWRLLRSSDSDSSLGYYYDWMTEHLGFSFFDEYKVMGMAAYGDPARYRATFAKLAQLLPEGQFAIDWRKVWFARQLIPRRQRDEPPTRDHMDFAAAAQELFERLVLHVARHFQAVTGQRRLCLAGGCALNCMMNGALLRSGLFDEMHVPPAAGDSGLALGAALQAYFESRPDPRPGPLRHAALGAPLGATASTAAALSRWSDLVAVREVDDPVCTAAQLLADGAVIGWMQGAAEYGPRALGHRSILADPRTADIRDLINDRIKGREAFRPFAPAALEEHAARYFDLPTARADFAFMSFTLPVRVERRAELGGVTHADGSARLQTVSRDRNRPFWELIHRFGELTGTHVLLNTSFNNNSEPMVDSVDDAVSCLLTCDLEYLVVDRFVVTKRATLADRWTEHLCPSTLEFIRIHEVDVDATEGVKRYEIRTSYNRSLRVPISQAVFELLLRTDGYLTVDALIAETLPAAVASRAAVLRELSELWKRRLIRLRPRVSATVAPAGTPALAC